MRISITARHQPVPKDLRAHAIERLERLSKLAHRPQDAAVVFDADHEQAIVELRLHLPQGHVQVATAEATDPRTALDRAATKLRRQLGKTMGKRRSR